MLVAQTCLGKHLAKLTAILQEGSSALLLDVGVGSLHWHVVGSLVGVGIGTVVVGVLTTQREVTFPHGIAQDELRGPEVIAAVGVALNGALCHSNRLNRLNRHHDLGGAARCLRVVEETIEVEVNTQLAHLTIIIGIEDMLMEVVLLADATL